MDIAEWLQQQGLSQLEGKLRDAGIDLDILGELDNAALTEIGLNFGDRRRLLKAIASLSTSSSPAQSNSAPDWKPAATVTRSATTAAERRQLTVMFCDLVGSTSLSSKLDPEDLRSLVGSYHEAVASAVTPYRGHVAQFLGDGVLVYFGYPQAHEDDAVRAVSSALAVKKIVSQLKGGSDTLLQIRIGIATGPVVVGEIGVGTPAAELSATGETPNLAARLQALAQPGEIIIAPDTRRLLGSSFELSSLGQQSLKGIDKPVEPWRVLAERGAASRFEAQRTHELTQLVGRDSEVALLLERWSMAREGEGQVVLLSGEAGIGKSRISLALKERLNAAPSTTVLWQCSPYFSNSALYPVVQQLERAAGIVSVDGPQERSSKLEQALTPAALGNVSIGYLLKLLGLPDQGRIPVGQTPQQEKSQSLKALIDVVLGLAKQQPVLLLLEDAHWVDPTTEELLVQAIERLRDARVLILVTSRPEYSANWNNPTNLTRLALSRLGHRQSAALISSVTEGRALPESVLAEIVRKTDGIPLFVEELTKTVIESGLLRQTDTGYELQGSLSSLAIPSTLQDSLMARLDRLAPAKEMAQVGAAIGRVFSHRLLAAVLQMPEARLNEAIDDLVRSDLMFRSGSGQDSIYTFKHALVRDTAYNSMVKSQRAMRHGQIAVAIESNEPETVANQPELLAHHYQESGSSALAFHYWTAAGDYSTKRMAIREAVKYYQSAIALFPHLDAGARTPETEIELTMKLGLVLVNSEGYNSPATRMCFARALDLSSGSGDIERYVMTCGGVAPTLFASGRFSDVIDLFGKVPPSQIDAAAVATRVVYAICTGIPWLLTGHLDRSWTHFHQAIQLSDREKIPRDLMSGGGAAPVVVRAYASRVQAYKGNLDQALALTDRSVEIATALEHAPTIAWAHHAAAMQRILKGDMPEAERHARLVLEIAERHGITMRIGLGLLHLGHVNVATGKIQEGIQQVREGYAIWESSGGKLHCTEYAVREAMGLLERGRVDEAEEFIAIGERIERECEERVAHAELLRLRARLTELDNDAPGAEAGYRRALETAEKQGAKLFSLRAATDLTRLLKRQGLGSDGLAILKPIYAQFTEGHAHPDLVQAKAMMEGASP